MSGRGAEIHDWSLTTESLTPPFHAVLPSVLLMLNALSFCSPWIG